MCLQLSLPGETEYYLLPCHNQLQIKPTTSQMFVES